MKIALDPYMLRRVPLPRLPASSRTRLRVHRAVAAEDFLPFFCIRGRTRRRSRVPEGAVARGVEVCSVLPLYRWSGPDEDERQAAVRYWKRAIEITVGPRRAGDELRVQRPARGGVSRARRSSGARWRSCCRSSSGEGIRLVLEPHPDDFVEDGRADRPGPRDRQRLVSFLYCAPHTFHQGGDIDGIMRVRRAAADPRALADSFDHRASSGLRYIVNPPGSPARIHQHLDIGQGEVDWDVFFATLAEVQFDGIATVCVFAWEERARESSTYNLDQIQQYLAKHGRPPG
jgi:myo-inositol catabolism protein IolH